MPFSGTLSNRNICSHFNNSPINEKCIISYVLNIKYKCEYLKIGFAETAISNIFVPVKSVNSMYAIEGISCCVFHTQALIINKFICCNCLF